MGRLRIECTETQIEDAIKLGSARLEALRPCDWPECGAYAHETLGTILAFRGMTFATIDKSRSRISIRPRPRPRPKRKPSP